MKSDILILEYFFLKIIITSYHFSLLLYLKYISHFFQKEILIIMQIRWKFNTIVITSVYIIHSLYLTFLIHSTILSKINESCNSNDEQSLKRKLFLVQLKIFYFIHRVYFRGPRQRLTRPTLLCTFLSSMS